MGDQSDVGNNPDDPSNCPIAVPGGDTQLKHTVSRIARDRALAPFDRNRRVADAVEAELKTHGSFLRSYGGRLFYFPNSERRLLDVFQSRFLDFLKMQTDLGAEALLRFVVDRMQSAAKRAKTIEVQVLSCFGRQTGNLVVSDGGPGVWRRAFGGDWTPGANGDDGLFFLTETTAESWTPDFKENKSLEDLDWLLQQFRFPKSVDGFLRKDQVSLLLATLQHSFFPSLRRARLVPMFFGLPGSGKTTALRLIGRLFSGRRFDISEIKTLNSESSSEAFSDRVIAAVDNVDPSIGWFQDALSAYATGANFVVRRRHSAGESVSFEPPALLLASSRYGIRRQDIAERVLPLYCLRPQRFVPDYVILEELDRRRGAIMGDLLRSLGPMADILAKVGYWSVFSRMADFSSFFLRLSPESEVPQAAAEAQRLLTQLLKAQGALISEHDDLVAVLSICLEKAGGVIGRVLVGDLYLQFRKIAREHHLLVPDSVQGFGQRLANMEATIELELDVHMRLLRGHGNRRYISLTRISRPERDVGDEQGQG